MVAVKPSIAVERELWEQVRARAAELGVSTSSYVADVLRREQNRERRLADGKAAMAEWQRIHGAFTPEELAEADRELDEAGIG